MNIIFDIGNVLIRWDIHAALGSEFADRATLDVFLERSDFYAWNAQQDAGRSISDALATANPAHAPLFALYFERFDKAIADKIDETWRVMADLRAAGHTIFGLTNWSNELYPIAQRVHPE